MTPSAALLTADVRWWHLPHQRQHIREFGHVPVGTYGCADCAILRAAGWAS